MVSPTIEAQSSRRPALVLALGILMVGQAAVFLLAAALHLGVRIPLGVTELVEPQILPAFVVEEFCGLLLAISAVLVLARSPLAWLGATVAHGIAIGGVLLGMVALAAGRGPRTETNDLYHQIMLVTLVVGLILLATPAARAALGRAGQG
jgi:hypothetical protein